MDNSKIKNQDFINHLNNNYNQALKRCTSNYSIYYITIKDLNIALLQYKDLYLQQQEHAIVDLQLTSKNKEGHTLSFSVLYGYADGIILNKHIKDTKIQSHHYLEIKLDNKNKLFAGKKNGLAFLETLFVDIKDYSLINLKIAPEVVIASSFYLGLLSRFFEKFKSKNEILNSLQINGESCFKIKNLELERAIYRFISDY